MFEKRLKETYGYGTKDVYVAPGATEENGYHFHDATQYDSEAIRHLICLALLA